jgi:hypothetical protein
MSISPSKDDFVGEFKPTPLPIKLHGQANGLTIAGQGTVMWAILDREGQLRMLKVPAYYVPASGIRLLSTSSLLQTYEDETITLQAHQLTLSGVSCDSTRESIVARVDPRNNLPTSQAYRYDGDSRITTDSFDAWLTVASVMNDGVNTTAVPSAEPTSGPRESYPPASVVTNNNLSALSSPVTMHLEFATRENVSAPREHPHVPTAAPGAEPVSATPSTYVPTAAPGAEPVPLALSTMQLAFAARENVSATRERPTAPSALTITPFPAPPTPPTLPPREPSTPQDGTQGHGYLAQVDSSPSSVKSCLGYIIALGGAPLIWKSQLQSEISLSTQESEIRKLNQGW